MKIVLLIILSFAIGFGSSYLVKKNPDSVKVHHPEEKKVFIGEREIKPEIHNHAAHEKEMQVMLDQAREYYGKAFKLFLMSVGFKLNQNQSSDLNELINDPQDFIQENEDKIKAPIENEGPEVFTNDLMAMNPKNLQGVITGLKEFQDDDSYAMLRGSLNNLLRDPSVFYAKGKYTEKFQRVKRFNGQYFGKLYLFDGKHKGKIDYIDLDINYTLKGEDDIDGTFNLKLIRDGEVYSDSNGRGGNRDIKIRKGQLLIDVGPNWFFHFKSKKIKVANYYQNGKLVGTALFKRK